MPIKVVHIKKFHGPVSHYIGRKWDGYPESMFHNPFRIGKDGTREEVLLKFFEYWYSPDNWLLRADALTFIQDSDTLACWCKPLACHGDIIAGYLNWKRQELQLW